MKMIEPKEVGRRGLVSELQGGGGGKVKKTKLTFEF